MYPQDGTVYVYGNVPNFIEWLHRYRLPYVHIIDTIKKQVYIPQKHQEVILNYKACAIIGQYSSYPILTLDVLKSILLTNNISIIDDVHTLSLNEVQDKKKYDGICTAKNMKDGCSCTYTSFRNRYCGAHYKCSLKRVCINIYYNNEDYVHDSKFRQHITNIHHHDKNMTENIEIGITESLEHITKHDMKFQQDLLLSNTTRPLFIVGWGENIIPFDNEIDCLQHINELRSLIRCVYVDKNGIQCDHVTMHTKSSFCKYHSGIIHINIVSHDA